MFWNIAHTRHNLNLNSGVWLRMCFFSKQGFTRLNKMELRVSHCRSIRYINTLGGKLRQESHWMASSTSGPNSTNWRQHWYQPISTGPTQRQPWKESSLDSGYGFQKSCSILSIEQREPHLQLQRYALSEFLLNNQEQRGWKGISAL